MSETPIFTSVERDLDVTYDDLAAAEAEPAPVAADPGAADAAPTAPTAG